MALDAGVPVIPAAVWGGQRLFTKHHPIEFRRGVAVTVVLEANHQVPESAKFLHGDVYRAYVFVGDAAGLLFVIGILTYRLLFAPIKRGRIDWLVEKATELGVFALQPLACERSVLRLAAEREQPHCSAEACNELAPPHDSSSGQSRIAGR